MNSNPSRNWHKIDASEKILGRLATQIAELLQGKHKAGFVKYMDQGDYVVVLNAEKIGVTGGKDLKKVYDHYTGYPGGRKEATLKDMRAKRPTEILYTAVHGMLPKNKLRSKMLRRLKLVVGSVNPYESQTKN